MEESDVLTRMTKGSQGGGNTSPKQEKKKQVCAKIQLAEDGHEVATKPGFAEELQAHFLSLPTRYALDLHTDRAEDVLTLRRLLEDAKISEKRPVFHVRAVQPRIRTSPVRTMTTTTTRMTRRRRCMSRRCKKGYRMGFWW